MVFYMSPIHHIAHLQPLFQFLTTPECNYYILHAQLVLPYSLFNNVTFRHVAFLAFPFEQRSREIFQGICFPTFEDLEGPLLYYLPTGVQQL
jgi:hypothetical protein